MEQNYEKTYLWLNFDCQKNFDCLIRQKNKANIEKILK